MNPKSDKEIIESIVNGKAIEVRKAIRDLYNSTSPKIMRQRTNGGFASLVTEEELEEAFQDAMLITFEYLRKGNFEIKSKLSTFIYGVTKKLVLYRARDNRKHNNLLLDENLEVVDTSALPDELDNNSKYLLLKQGIESLPKSCKNILIAFFYDELSASQIAAKFGYTLEVFYATKSRCIKKLSEKIKKENFND